MVNPALKSPEGQAPRVVVPDPTERGAEAATAPKDWTIHRPEPEKVEDPPPKPISKVLMDHLKSMWNASASAVTVEQVNQALTRETSIQPSQIPGELAKQTLVYQPSKIQKNEKI